MGITGVELTPVAYDRSRHQTIEYQKIALLAALILGDALVVATSFVLAYIVRFFTNLPIFVEGAMQPEFYAPFIAITRSVLDCAVCSAWFVPTYGLIQRNPGISSNL